MVFQKRTQHQEPPRRIIFGTVAGCTVGQTLKKRGKAYDRTGREKGQEGHASNRM